MFEHLTEEEEKELWRLYGLYWREANRAAEARACLAGCIMFGSALETLLMLMINVYTEEAVATGKCPSQRGASKPLLAWNLAELLRVVKAAGWLPYSLDDNDDWDARRAKVGDYAEVSRMIRNFVHPSRYAKDYYRKRITKKTAERQRKIVLACRDWLLAHVHRSIGQWIREEEDQP